jgi:hypothetical protein
MALGKFFIKSSGEVNAIALGPKGFCCRASPDLESLGSTNPT